MKNVVIDLMNDYTPRSVINYVKEAARYYHKLDDESKMTPEELVKNNLLFVFSVAKKYSNCKVPFEDIVQDGMIGLIEASRLFDSTRGFKFISFAVAYIQKYIIDGLNANIDLVRLPIHIKSGFLILNKFSDKYYTEHCEYPTRDILITKTRIQPRIIDLYLCKSTLINIDMNLNNIDDKNKYTILDVYDGSIDNDSWEISNYIFSKLDILKKTHPKEAEIIQLYYLEEYSQYALSLKFHCSRESIRGKIKKGLKILKSIS